MPTVKILAKGQVVIPAKLHKKYRIRPGAKLELLEYGDFIYLISPVADPIKAASGSFPRKPSLTRGLLRDRKKWFA